MHMPFVLSAKCVAFQYSFLISMAFLFPPLEKRVVVLSFYDNWYPLKVGQPSFVTDGCVQLACLSAYMERIKGQEPFTSLTK